MKGKEKLLEAALEAARKLYPEGGRAEIDSFVQTVYREGHLTPDEALRRQLETWRRNHRWLLDKRTPQAPKGAVRRIEAAVQQDVSGRARFLWPGPKPALIMLAGIAVSVAVLAALTLARIITLGDIVRSVVTPLVSGTWLGTVLIAVFIFAAFCYLLVRRSSLRG